MFATSISVLVQLHVFSVNSQEMAQEVVFSFVIRFRKFSEYK